MKTFQNTITIYKAGREKRKGRPHSPLEKINQTHKTTINLARNRLSMSLNKQTKTTEP